MKKLVKNKAEEQKTIPKNRIMRVENFICSRCRVQATGETDRICGICKAIGKTAEPVAASDFWEEITLGIKHAGEFFKKYLLQRETQKYLVDGEVKL